MNGVINNIYIAVVMPPCTIITLSRVKNINTRFNGLQVTIIISTRSVFVALSAANLTLYRTHLMSSFSCCSAALFLLKHKTCAQNNLNLVLKQLLQSIFFLLLRRHLDCKGPICDNREDPPSSDSDW